MPTNRPLDREALKLVRGETPHMWEDFEFGRPGSMVYYFNDFLSFIPTEWTITEVEAGAGDAAETVTDEHGGVLLLTNDAADNDAITLQLGGQTAGESVTPASGRIIYFEARLKVSDATQSDFLAGLVVTDTTPLATTNGIYFRKDDGDTQLDCECNNTSVVSTESNVVTVSTSYLKLGFKVYGVDKVEFWVNDNLEATITSQIPTTELRPTIHIQNGEAVAKTMSLDYIAVAATR